jgi:hypothetical protein
MSLSQFKSNAAVESESDFVASFGPVESGLYPSKVTMAYMEISQGGATAVVVHLKSDSGREITQKLWAVSGNAKGNKNTFTDKEGNEQYLPGFNIANSLSLLTVGKELSDLETEDKLVNIYDYDLKKEVPVSMPVFPELLGQEVIAGVVKQIVDKNVKGEDGVYRPGGETRAENDISKLFRTRDRLTTAEIRGGATEPVFIETWKARWEGKVDDKSTAGSKPAAANDAGGSAAKPTTSLFNPK